MQNLIANAIKFSKPDCPPHIIIRHSVATGAELKHEKLKPHENYSYITFEDNGIGFEPEHGEKIFGVFQKLHDKNTYKGTGIGLAIVRKIVENHNGLITATGEPMNGAKFDIYIPN
jgi:signal transduction histidine kinase